MSCVLFVFNLGLIFHHLFIIKCSSVSFHFYVVVACFFHLHFKAASLLGKIWNIKNVTFAFYLMNDLENESFKCLNDLWHFLCIKACACWLLVLNGISMGVKEKRITITVPLAVYFHLDGLWSQYWMWSSISFSIPFQMNINNNFNVVKEDRMCATHLISSTLVQQLKNFFFLFNFASWFYSI